MHSHDLLRRVCSGLAGVPAVAFLAFAGPARQVDWRHGPPHLIRHLRNRFGTLPCLADWGRRPRAFHRALVAQTLDLLGADADHVLRGYPGDLRV